MKWCRFFLIVVLVAILDMRAMAGIFFWKHAKPIPAERVPELITTLKTDQDENKRAQAAEELRGYETSDYPQIVPALVDAATNDPKPGVRVEAIQSLSRVRPVSQEAGSAMEQAMAKDSSMRVRLLARSSLVQYHLFGYRSSQGDAPPATGTTVMKPGESTPPPPASNPPVMVMPTQPRLRPVPAQSSVVVSPRRQSQKILTTTAEPPLLNAQAPAPTPPPATIAPPVAQPTDGPSLMPPE